MHRSLVPVGLLVLVGLGACKPRSDGAEKEPATRAASSDETFGELRTIKGSLRVQAPGEAPRAPYRRERLLDGEAITMPKGALAWMRRDGGATWLIAGPARVSVRADSVELNEGRAFVDSELGAPVQITTPRGSIELSDARASLDVSADGVATIYVLRGAARAGLAGRASAGELLTLRKDGSSARTPVVSWEDWTGGLATADPIAEPAPFGIGTVGARKPGAQGKPRFSLVVQRLDVKVTVEQDFAVTEVDETFVNPSSDVVEGIFSFRTPPFAVLSRFGVDRHGSLVWGQVKELHAAVRQYESNVYQGSEEDPALLQWAGGGLYNARLYPIGPGTTRRVVTRYSEWLSREGPNGERRLYVYPMAAEGARASLPRIEELRFTLDLTHARTTRVRAGMGGKRDGKRIVVKAYDFVPRADLAVELFDAGQALPIAYRAPHRLGPEDVPQNAEANFANDVARQESDYLAVPLRALGKGADTPPGIDLGLVIDSSAATEPGALAIARSMASALLAQLGPDDRAALWAGDASLRPVVEGSGTFSAVDDTKRRAWLSALAGVERGGATDLGALLSEAASRLDPKRRGAILYVGDGQPTVGELVPKSLRERLSRLPATTRILAAGVGSEPNVALLEALVRGAPVEQVSDGYSAARAALRLLEAAGRPVWLGAKVELGPGIERVLPRELPPISSDETTLVVGRITGKLPTDITLTGSGGTFTRRLTVTNLADSGDLRRRWGQARLGELMAEGAGRSSLVELARRYGLVSPFTALYVPTEREQRAPAEEEEQQSRPTSDSEAVRRRWKPWSFGGSAEPARAAAAPAPSATVMQEAASDAPKTADVLKGGEVPTEVALAQEPTKKRARAAVQREIAPPAAPPGPRDKADDGVESGVEGGVAGTPVPAAASPATAPAADEIAAGWRSEPLSNAMEQSPKKSTAIQYGASGLGLSGIGGGSKPEGIAKPAAPSGTATIGNIALGESRVANGARVVAGMRAGFRACYQRALAQAPDTAGSVWLELKIDARGAVDEAFVTPAVALPEALLKCVRARAKAAQFDAPEGGSTTLGFNATFALPGSAVAPAAPPGAQKPKPNPEPKPVAGASRPLRSGLGLIDHEPRPCGAAADLPLIERKLLWRERLYPAHSVALALSIYTQALRDCEAVRWDERAALLVFIVDRLKGVRDRVELWRALLAVSPAAADAVYRFLMLRVQTASELKELHEALGLKRIEPTMLAALLKKATSETERLSLLRGASERFDDDTELALLVLDAYEDARDDAGGRAWARRLRRRVDASSHVRTNVGEYYLRLAKKQTGAPAQRDAEEARRTFGELVEFAPEDPLARRRLGDLLRAHGWYEEAFRQYQTLAELTPDDPSVPLLLAAAANGVGRVEEAVRWAQKVADAGAPDGSSEVSLAGRALGSAFLAWARLDAVRAGRSEEAERLRTRAARLATSEGSSSGVRFILTWEHPELRPSLWTSALGSPTPAPDNLPLYGVAQAFVADTPPPLLELRLDPEDAARAARIGATAVLTAIANEGTATERIARLEVGFRDAEQKALARLTVRLENGELKLETREPPKEAP